MVIGLIYGKKIDDKRFIELYKLKKNDAEIGRIIGVTRTAIMRYRQRRNLISNHITKRKILTPLKSNKQREKNRWIWFKAQSEDKRLLKRETDRLALRRHRKLLKSENIMGLSNE